MALISVLQQLESGGLRSPLLDSPVASSPLLFKPAVFASAVGQTNWGKARRLCFRITMRSFLFGFFAAAACCSASGEVILNIPSQIVPPSSSAEDVSFDVGFVLTAPDVSQDLVGYDLYLEVTGGDGLSITGVGAGSNPLGSTPVYAVTTDSGGDMLYLLRGFHFVGHGHDHQRQHAVGRRGAASGGRDGHVPDRGLSGSIRPRTRAFYSGVDGSGNPIAIAGMGFQNGAVSVAMPGDANLDGKVDINDLTIVLADLQPDRHDLDPGRVHRRAARWTSTT